MKAFKPERATRVASVAPFFDWAFGSVASVMSAPHFVQHLRIDKKNTLASPVCVKQPDDMQLRFSKCLF